MPFSTRVCSSLVLGLGLAAGCVADDYSDDELGQDVVAVRTLNAMSSNLAATFSVEGRQMAQQPLGQNAATAQLAGTADGRELLKYIARCALKPGELLKIRDASGTLHYPLPAGNLALLPAWTSRGLTETEDRLLVGCLLAHVNAHQIQVEFSIRNAALVTDSRERKDFPVAEGAFYGEFGVADPDASTLRINACYSAALLAVCGADVGKTVATINNRLCAQTPGACDVNVVGQCVRAPSKINACATEAGDLVTDCFDQPSDKFGNWPSAATNYLDTPMVSYVKKPICDPKD